MSYRSESSPLDHFTLICRNPSAGLGLQCYSQRGRLLSYQLFPKSRRLERPPEAVPPLMPVERWNSRSTSQIMERPGNMRLTAL